MLSNYLKTALRHLRRNKLYGAINVVGLAVGITCTLLAVLYWKDEHGFDEFHKNIPHLYRVTTNRISNKEGDRVITGNTGHVHIPAFKAGVPELKEAVRVLGGDIGTIMIHGDKSIHLKPLWVDSGFFNVFTFRFLQGNPATALSAINSVVLTETTAKKFFNSTDVVGKLLTQEVDPSQIKLGKPLVVTGVVKDPPGNSSLQFDALMTFSFMELSFENNNWFGGWLGGFVVIHPDADLEKVKAKFNAIYDENAKKQLNDKEYNWMGFDPKIRFGLQPMNDVHFNTALTTSGWNEGGVVNVASPVYSYTFMGIALFILVMAAINFINISIASSLKRAKEVGIRKISGGNGRQIIFQFLVESAILCIVSFLIAVILMALLLPLFTGITGKQLFLSNIFDSKLLLYFSALLVLITLLTGLYPAFVLSRFDATKVLYNKQKLSSRNIFGRSLVVLQFSLAIFLVACTIVYYSQMNFIRTKDLGYNPSQIITTEIYGDRGDYAPILNQMRQELTRQASIKSVSFGNNGDYENIEINNKKIRAFHKNIDEHYLSVKEIPLLAGRNVKPGTASKNEVVVNQSFSREAGMQDPLGQTLLINRGYDTTYATIVGVFKDYHFSSLREPIKPMILRGLENEGQGYLIWVKFEKVNQQKAMAAVEKVYKSIMPQALYQYHFVDEKNAQEYKQEQRWHKLINFASILALILCSLGLFGLAHLATHQRVKEIGVRKVLGASVAQIVSLFTTSFLKLVLVAIIIAVPTARIVINKWLENFAYRIEIGWWMFALAGLIAIIIAILTVSTQAIKAALANPAKSLKTE